MRNLILGAALLALAGCQSPAKVYFWAGAYDDVPRSEYVYGASESDVRTTIIGAPFPGRKDDTARAVLAAMNTDDKNRQSNFTTRPKRTTRNYHVVMAFNPRNFGRRADLCSGDAKFGGPNADNRITLVAVFCDGRRLVFAFSGTHPVTNGPEDPAFYRFVRDLMFYFVPSSGLTDDDDPD